MCTFSGPVPPSIVVMESDQSRSCGDELEQQDIEALGQPGCQGREGERHHKVPVGFDTQGLSALFVLLDGDDDAPKR